MKLMVILKYMLCEGNKFKGDMLLLKNMEKSPNLGKRYGQDVEPAGFYAIEYHDYQSHLLQNSNYKLFKVNIKSPLIVNVDDDNLIEWKRELSKQYQSVGKALTRKLISNGYDVIITYNTVHNETGEIIVLDTSKLQEVN